MVTPAIRNRSTAADTQRKGEREDRLPRGTGVVRQPTTAAHRGRCALRCVGNVSALQLRRPISNGRGVGDAAPYGGSDRVCFSGAVRWSGVKGVCLSVTVMFHAATFVSLSPVGCTVLGAPRSRDRRGGLDADVRRERFYPRYPRCVNRALTDQRFIFRGHSPRTISMREGAHHLRHIPQPSLRAQP